MPNMLMENTADSTTDIAHTSRDQLAHQDQRDLGDQLELQELPVNQESQVY